MNEQHFVGLDLGSSSLKACLASKYPDEERLQVHGVFSCRSEGIEYGTISNPNRAAMAIQRLMQQIQQHFEGEIVNFTVNVSGRGIHSAYRNINNVLRREDKNDNEVTYRDVLRLREDMQRVAQNEFQQQSQQVLHLLPQEYLLDESKKTLDPVGMAAMNILTDFHIITAERHCMENLQKAIQKAERKIAQTFYSPLASAKAVAEHEEVEEGVAVVDIGAGTTEISIIQNGLVRFISLLPLGSELITRDIKENLNIGTDQAELLKVKFGTALAEKADPDALITIPGRRNRQDRSISAVNLAKIIQSRMEEILDMAHGEIIRSGLEERLSGLVFCGGGANLRDLNNLAELMTGLHCRIGSAAENIGADTPQDLNDPAFATSIGLTLAQAYGIDERELRYVEHEALSPGSRSKKEGNFIDRFFGNLRKFLSDDDLQ